MSPLRKRGSAGCQKPPLFHVLLRRKYFLVLHPFYMLPSPLPFLHLLSRVLIRNFVTGKPLIPHTISGYKDVTCNICHFQQPLSARPDVMSMANGGRGDGSHQGGGKHGPPPPQQQHYQQGPPPNNQQYNI